MNTQHNAHAPRQPHRQRGLSMVESMVTLTATLVALGSALPTLEQTRQRRHLDGLSAQLETDIQHARSLAVAQNRNLRLSFQADNAGSCWIVHSGAADACSCAADGSAQCQAGSEALRSERLPAGHPVQLSSNVRSMIFDTTKGTVSPTGTLRLLARDGREVRLVVNIMGRVRACSPQADMGYRAC